ncbi:rhodanese-like domain-containing protein [Streptomyces althioticus]|uniref:rhodanese-like domain-containing protein n=1 Tax=Streptomyces althioticus TaxID=83380 RepID=UPI0036829405
MRRTVDVRQGAEFAAGHVPGAVHIELGAPNDSAADAPAARGLQAQRARHDRRQPPAARRPHRHRGHFVRRRSRSRGPAVPRTRYPGVMPTARADADAEERDHCGGRRRGGEAGRSEAIAGHRRGATP